nr:L1_beta_lactamase [uncultured bacterium]AIA13841.1 L1_beta_lactamase [uncultured bacterium]
MKAQSDETARSWNRPVEPFHIIANIYYVGATEVSSFLITTPKGHILLDSGFAETVPLIQTNFKKLGFKIEDVKILINSHAHYDHAGGLALLKELTGAKLVSSEADAALLANGGKGDFQWGDELSYKPVKADRLLRDNDKVELGGVAVTARLTPGHTKGSLTWTMKVEEAGKQFDVVFAGSTSAPGYKLVDNQKYPGIIKDYAHTFQLLKSLPCDVFLAPHGSIFSMLEKAGQLKQDEKHNPFIDPKGYRNFIERTEKAYLQQLEKERQATKTN